MQNKNHLAESKIQIESRDNEPRQYKPMGCQVKASGDKFSETAEGRN